MVSFRRSDSRSTMSISCACSSDSVELLPQDLNRPAQRRERITDLVRDAGRHLADGGQPLFPPRVAFETPEISVTSWNVRSEPSRPSAVTRSVALSPMSRAPSPGAVPVVRAAAVDGLRVARQQRPELRRQLQHLRRRAVQERTAAGMPVMSSAARLNVKRRPGSIGRRQSARQAVDDVLVERLEIGDGASRRFEPARSARPLSFGQRAAQRRHGEERKHVGRHRVPATRMMAAAPDAAEPRWRQIARDRERIARGRGPRRTPCSGARATDRRAARAACCRR